ncbi:mitochondrial ATP synthase epsilon chain-domain-containing protein [Fomitopsis betulina]|nr:mitochondrial ATP synthase epsilon chain-domain-containing protein [Fomitopsis betulina]
MSSANWRNVFTFNKYTQIAARAVRQSLKESERVAAEKRGLTILRYQHWENGVGGTQTFLVPPEEAKKGGAV